MPHDKGHVIIIDDDAQMRSLLEDYFSGEGYRTTCFELAHTALEKLTQAESELDPQSVDLIISDIKMPKMTGVQFAEKLKRIHPSLPVILITAFGSIETAIEAMRKGAYDYIVKPFKLIEMGVTCERAIEYRRLQCENNALRTQVKKSWAMEKLIGKSTAMQAIFDMIRRVSNATANVLITGESGTGKEMVAQAIHESGNRKSQPFVAINCTAIPETLLESELFGHAKGAFTGATQRKVGLFEQASGGTLFLDEIGDLDPSLQSKLLRVLQDKKIRAVGENTHKEVDVRVIAATHKDLKAAIRQGRFREDLYYRLSVIPIVIPPLRHRQEDIPLLANHFLAKYAAANHSPVRCFSQGALRKLLTYPWQGNVRELENLIERVVVLAQNSQIADNDIPEPDSQSPEDFFGSNSNRFPTIEELEKRYIKLVLEKTGGRKDKAAQILGINRRTLYRKEQEYGFATPKPDLPFSAEPSDN